MGIEAFGLSLRFEQPGITGPLVNFLSKRDHVSIGPVVADTGFETSIGEYNDALHFIELQIRRESVNNRCNLAIRFSLCSYETIDTIFIDLTRDILLSWESEIWLMTSALKQKTHYLPGDENWLISALPDEIIAMRGNWQGSFGNKQGPVHVKDSFSFVGLKLK